MIMIFFLDYMRWSTRWNGKWRTIQNVQFVSFFSIKTNFAITNYYYWRCAYSTYLLGDATYPIWPYLLKDCKPRNSDMVDQIGFDQSMNKGHVLIKNAFGILKNWWKILKKINACVDWTPTITLACCTLHIFC